MPHLAEQILTPQAFTAEGVAFPVPIRPYPGRPIVCMVPREESIRGILIPKEVADKYQPDFGVVVGFKPRRDSDGDIIYRHDHELHELMKRGPVLVAVRPYTGIWYIHADFDWIPKGRLLKILGTVEDWSENVVAYVDEAVAA